MLADRYLERRYKEGLKDCQEEGRPEGLKKAHAAWKEWNAKRLEAEEQGREFTELPPGTNSDR